MLDSNTLSTYTLLKNKMDAAYRLLKKDPSIISANRHTAAAQAFNSFCVDTVKAMAEGNQSDSDKQQEILNNIDNYKTCKQCGSEVLYEVDDGHFIESSDFEPNFPGWCHTCLVEHCCSTNCLGCDLVSDHTTCSFKEMKNFYMNEV